MYITDFNQQGLGALNTGLGLGRSIMDAKERERQIAMQEQQMQQQAAMQPLKTRLLESQIAGSELSNQQQQVKINAEERMKANTELLTAITLPFESRQRFLKDAASTYQDPATKRMFDELINMDDDQQMQRLANMAEIAFGGSKSQQKDTRTAEEKNLARLQEIEATGDVNAANTFKKMLNITNEQKLSSAAEKEILKSQNEYFTAGKLAREMEVLSQDLKGVDIGGGFFKSTVSEALKDVLGSQDAVSDLRRRYRGIRTSQATTNLPPGPASDKDIELALSGFPKENANAAQIQSFLRGASKLSRINERYNEFKAEYIAENNSPKGLIKAWKEKTKDVNYLADIVSPEDQLLKVQDTSVVSDEDLLNKYGGM